MMMLLQCQCYDSVISFTPKTSWWPGDSTSKWLQHCMTPSELHREREREREFQYRKATENPHSRIKESRWVTTQPTTAQPRYFACPAIETTVTVESKRKTIFPSLMRIVTPTPESDNEVPTVYLAMVLLQWPSYIWLHHSPSHRNFIKEENRTAIFTETPQLKRLQSAKCKAQSTHPLHWDSKTVLRSKQL